jgi:hypothetical protein
MYCRGRLPVPLLAQPNEAAASGHKRLRDFEDADARDRWRSSWLRFPRLAEAVASPDLVLPVTAATESLCYQIEIERFAVVWYERGLPVPHDYLNADAQPSDPEARSYQHVRGIGNRVALAGVVPASRRINSALAPAMGMHSSTPCILSRRNFVTGSFVLFAVSMQLTPLVFAHCSGFDFMGADLLATVPVLSSKRAAIETAMSWADSMLLGAAAATFRVGAFDGGGAVYTAPIAFTPPPAVVARTTPDRKRLLRARATFLWLTIAALRGTPVGDVAAHAVSACANLRGPSLHGSPQGLLGQFGTFRFGVGAMAAFVDTPDGLPVAPSSIDAALARSVHEGDLLRRALLEHDGASRDDFVAWADRIRPPELGDIPPILLDSLPAFSDARFDEVTFSPIVAPLAQPWLPRLPTSARHRPAAARVQPSTLCLGLHA